MKLFAAFFLFDDRSYCYECIIAAVLCIRICHIFDLFDDGSYCCECKIAKLSAAFFYLTIILIVANVKLRSCLLHFLFDDHFYYCKCIIAAVLCIGIHHIFDLFDDGSYYYECKIAKLFTAFFYLMIIFIVANI